MKNPFSQAQGFTLIFLALPFATENSKLGIKTVGQLRAVELAMLEQEFGRLDKRISDLFREIDDSKVVPDRPTKSISAEDTFERDVVLSEIEPMIRGLAEKVWAASRKESRIARTVVLKLKTREFKILTRSHTPPSSPMSCEQLTDIALSLRQNVHLGSKQLFRLVGVRLSNFEDSANEPAQPELFK